MPTTLTPETIQAITRDYLKRELSRWELRRNEHDGPMPLDSHPSNWAMLIKEFEKDLTKPERVVARQKVKQEAKNLLDERGIEVDKDSDEFRALTRELLATKVDWAKEEQRRSQGDYSGGGSVRVAEALGMVGAAHHSGGGIVSVAAQPSPVANVLLSEAKDKYIQIKTADGWSKKSAQDISVHLSDFVELVGDIPTSSLDRNKMRVYHTALLNMPARRNTKRFRVMTLHELGQLDLPKDKRLAGNTLKTRFTNVQTFMNWMENEDYILSSKKLNDVLKIPKDRKPKDQPRGPFTTEDLTKLFSSPGYTQGKRGNKGGFNLAYQFWTPLIALHTGARREEVSQLHLSDVRQKDGVWVFDINDMDDKGVKTEAGIRVVPIHPALVELGILERVEHLKAKGHDVLFPSLKPEDPEDKYGENVGKWFTRFRRGRGVADEDPETKKAKTFHSFRHTVISALMVAGVDMNKKKEVVGHEGKDAADITAHYEHGFPVKTLYEDVICKLDFSEALDLEAMKGSPWIQKA